MKKTEVDLQLAENEAILCEEEETVSSEFEQKRALLEKTKIVRQTWSIIEIYRKIDRGDLVLVPDYQRGEVWNAEKKTAFIESLYMEIMIPPIYVVEIPSDSPLDGVRYEVVDGKQRLTAVREFITDKLVLSKKHLEYYADIFGGKTFSQVLSIEEDKTNAVLSSVLDIYVITKNSPEFTKYDIFARLNKGAEKLKVNEIRRAIYHSYITRQIFEFVDQYTGEKATQEQKKYYKGLFSSNDIKRFEDYGRFYRSIAFYLKSNRSMYIVEGYNSRPREMINTVLQSFQHDDPRTPSIGKDELICILEGTLTLKEKLCNVTNALYIIDACVPFLVENRNLLFEKLPLILEDRSFRNTLDRSPSTTKNVNERLKIVAKMMGY